MQSLNPFWLTMSLYYTQPGWHTLLHDFARPLLIEWLESGKIERFHLRFNHQQGDNIRLSLLCDELMAPAIAAEFDNRAMAFLTKYPSTGRTQDGRPSGLFTNFPNNCIRYGLFDEEGVSAAKLAHPLVDLHFQLSKLMLMTLRDTKIDQELLFSFCLYLLWAFIKTRFPTSDQASVALAGLSECIPATASGQQIDFFSAEDPWLELFKKNQDIFSAILQDVWQTGQRSDELAWLRDWEEKGLSGFGSLPLKEALSFHLRLLFDHLGMEWSLSSQKGILDILLHTLKGSGLVPVLPERPKREMDITVILTVWKRDHLEEQIRVIVNQSVSVKAIWIYHCGAYREPYWELITRYPDLRYQLNTEDFGYFGRFSLGLHARTKYLYIMDDDVIPSESWLETCLELCARNNNIISSAGRIIPHNDYIPEKIKDKDWLTEYFIGDGDSGSKGNYCPEDTPVDFGCNSWFLQTEWLSWFWSIKPFTREIGEDIHLSASCEILGKIKTLCPLQHPAAVCGNLKKEYGFDSLASWRGSGFYTKRRQVLKYWIDVQGWRPMRWVR